MALTPSPPHTHTHTWVCRKGLRWDRGCSPHTELPTAALGSGCTQEPVPSPDVTQARLQAQASRHAAQSSGRTAVAWPPAQGRQQCGQPPLRAGTAPAAPAHALSRRVPTHWAACVRLMAISSALSAACPALIWADGHVEPCQESQPATGQRAPDAPRAGRPRAVPRGRQTCGLSVRRCPSWPAELNQNITENSLNGGC